MSLDSLPKGSLDQFHNHRIKKYKYLYYCNKCTRSFDSEKSANICKFCGSPEVRDMTPKKK